MARIPGKNYWKQHKGFDIFKIFVDTFLILRIIQRYTIINEQRSFRLYSLILSEFKHSWMSSTNFRKIFKFKFIESLSSGSRIVLYRENLEGRTDRQTDM